MSKLLDAAAATAPALVAYGMVFAQPVLGFATTDPQTELVERIAELRAEGGPTPASVIEPLRALALQHQESGDHALAIVALEEARYVTRVHRGLTSADEALLLRQQIRSEKELGDHERVWNLEQDMVTIARQHHDDIRMLPIFRDLAEDWSGVIEEVRAGGRPPMIHIGCYYGALLPPYDDTRGKRHAPLAMGDAGGGPNCTSGSKDGIIRRLESELLMYYADAIEIILKTGDYASQELRQFEKAALRLRSGRRVSVMRYGESGGSFTYCSGGTLEHFLALEILDSCLAPVGRADNFVAANVGGPVGLIRLISYEIRSAAPAADRARAIVELADFTLAAIPVDRRHLEERTTNLALAFYERAYRELRQGDDAEASTAQIFAPELPVTLPTFRPNPFAATATAESTGYIDVAFAVTKHGTGERIEILATSRNASRAEQRDLIRLIESTTFRPRMIGGELADAAPVVVRHHLSP
ncbi:MAG TPA: hypothetical protein VKA43_10950 [Gammaproteobacteria bacterium]|nr:hypothetical protein [Gammaproteobacteria bacterium]